jgi:hypothetical protein
MVRQGFSLVKMTRKKASHLTTFRKLQQLGFDREQFMKQHGKPPLLSPACRKILIAPRTVKRNVVELFQKWYDMNFHR